LIDTAEDDIHGPSCGDELGHCRMARARIELATPRFSVVARCANAGRGRRRAGKMSVQIAIIGT